MVGCMIQGRKERETLGDGDRSLQHLSTVVLKGSGAKPCSSREEGVHGTRTTFLSAKQYIFTLHCLFLVTPLEELGRLYGAKFDCCSSLEAPDSLSLIERIASKARLHEAELLCRDTGQLGNVS